MLIIEMYEEMNLNEDTIEVHSAYSAYDKEFQLMQNLQVETLNKKAHLTSQKELNEGSEDLELVLSKRSSAAVPELNHLVSPIVKLTKRLTTANDRTRIEHRLNKKALSEDGSDVEAIDKVCLISSKKHIFGCDDKDTYE
jgi:hypothetical protein